MTKVFANNSTVVCAAGSGKVVAAFPDVCMSPPGPPAGPVPVPYADTSHARDTKSGSKRVKIGGKPVFLAGKSHLASKPLGDDGQVFPRAPCDVFRAHDPVRTKKISKRWTAATKTFRTDYLAAHPDAIATFHARNPKELRVRKSKTSSKVDHLTPKGAGGCPDNPGNLQPHELLCSTCKMIDDTFGTWQGNNSDWLRAWNEAFRKTGIKRRRLDAFTPGWW